MNPAMACTEAEYLHHVDQSDGVCLACGAWRDGCEPDAEGYPCDSCDAREVMGAELALVSGYLEFRP